MPNCKSCNKEIYFLKTRSGHIMPVDAETVPNNITSTGDIATTIFDAKTMTSHFVTCPQANEHRRKHENKI
jgi:hypothetical protein